ncbi:uncharacterized protein [Solanum tuberosum]|uniref:uncharacterized protein n=1 Tax=Solanum tuberosum TaxID=4113 RepID=UPI00073A433A|nr:PREDICTED: uncharacterized protein LOC107062738 [Solanum tuberosum]
MTDAGYSGDIFTWTNGGRLSKRILIKLVRVMYFDKWSRSFQMVKKVKETEEQVEKAELVYASHNSDQNRGYLHAKYAEQIHWLKKESSILKQKSIIKWQEDGDSNTKYFHSVIRHKRKRVHLYRIKDEQDNWLQGDERIAEAATRHFNSLFSQTDQQPEFKILDNIESIITDEDNDLLTGIPNSEEIYQAITSLNPDSAPGPDGYNGRFYQATWDTIKDDLIYLVVGSGGGSKRRKTWWNVIPHCIWWTEWKERNSRNFEDISNSIHKLDMAKAYDIVSRLFLKSVIRKMGFSKIFIDLIQRLTSEVWHSVMINGSLINSMINKGCIGYSMHQKGPLINHLCYAADIVMFSSGNMRTIKMIMKTLRQYERESGQMINIDKSVFLTATHSPDSTRRMINRINGYNHQLFPMKYLGCSIFQEERELKHFADIAKTIMNKVQGWHGNILSSRGRSNIIKHVLQSQTLHILAAMSPPKDIIKQTIGYFANFFWGQTDNKKRYHWSSWANMCYPLKEGGTGFKRLEDICKAFAAKRWWRLRTENNIWSQFMMHKYCQRGHVVARKIQRYHSSIWKDLLRIKAEVEPFMLRKINDGQISFWWDNWSGIGSLVLYHHTDSSPGNLTVADCLDGDHWDMDYISRLLPNNICQIIQSVNIGPRNWKDQAIWTSAHQEILLRKCFSKPQKH